MKNKPLCSITNETSYVCHCVSIEGNHSWVKFNILGQFDLPSDLSVSKL